MTKLGLTGCALGRIIGATTALWLGSAVAAENWQLGIQPRLEIGVLGYNLDFGSTAQLLPATGAIGTTELSFADVMPTVGFGITVFADRFYLDASAQSAFAGSASDSNAFTAASPGAVVVTNSRFASDDLSRNEYALAFGYSATDALAIYVGYKWAVTYLDDMQGSGPGEIRLANGATVGGTFSSAADYEFSYDGPFIGTTVGLSIPDGPIPGRLALNVAIALLDGNVTASSDWAAFELANGVSIPVDDPSAVFDSSGRAVGVLIGASWVGETGVARLFYSVGVNGYNYDFNSEDQGRSDINESVLQLKVGLAYAF